MSIEGTRRILETTCPETANQYLRFGWTLINQCVVKATSDQPEMVKYVLVSARRLEDTRELITLTDSEAVNERLAFGWKLIDKYVTSHSDPLRRDETIHYVLAWQLDDPPPQPGAAPVAKREFDMTLEPDDELFDRE